MSNKSFEFIEKASPKEIRDHLDRLHKLSQCSNIRFWESLSFVDMFLVSKGLSESRSINIGTEEINNSYYRKEKEK